MDKPIEARAENSQIEAIGFLKNITSLLSRLIFDFNAELKVGLSYSSKTTTRIMTNTLKSSFAGNQPSIHIEIPVSTIKDMYELVMNNPNEESIRVGINLTAAQDSFDKKTNEYYKWLLDRRDKKTQ